MDDTCLGDLNIKYIYAVRNNDITSVREALTDGANVDYISEYNMPAIHHAIYTNNLDILICMREFNVDENQQYKLQRAHPLHIAMIVGNIDIVNFLLLNITEVGDIDPDIYGYHPFHSAIYHNFLEGVKAVSTHININIMNKEKETALTMACRLGFEDIVKYLLSIGSIISDAPVAAAKFGHLELVKTLWNFQKKVNIKAREQAILHGHMRIYNYLNTRK